MKTRLGVLSDTHLPKPVGLSACLLTMFEGVDAILHAGDVTRLDALEPLQRIAPVYLVSGNNDPPELAARFGFRRALRWRGWRIGLVHGDEGPRATTPHNAREAFRDLPPCWEEIPARTSSPVGELPGAPLAAVPEGRPDRVRLAAPACDVPLDCIVFGHSHQPYGRPIDGVLMLNPGSPTERRREPRASFVLLEADASSLEARFFYI